MTAADSQGPGVRGHLLDRAWNDPRSKRRMCEPWGIGREVAAKVALT